MRKHVCAASTFADVFFPVVSCLYEIHLPNANWHPNSISPGYFRAVSLGILKGSLAGYKSASLHSLPSRHLKVVPIPGFLFMSLMRSLKVINDLIFHLEGLKRAEKKMTPEGYIQSQMPGTCDCSLNWKTIFVDVIKRSRWDCPRLSRWP